MMIRPEGGAEYKVSAWNASNASLHVRFGALNLPGCRTDLSKCHTSNELEGACMVEHVVTLECEFGDLLNHNAAVSIENLT